MTWRNTNVVFYVVITIVAMTMTLARAEDTPQRIRRMTWIVHPYCWSMFGDGVPAGADPERWKACLTWERDNHKKYMEMISRMEADEAVIIYPIGSSPPMRELQEHAQSELGDRCVVVKRSSVDPNFLLDVKDPIRKYLDDAALPGKSEWIKQMLTSSGTFPEPEGLAKELEQEVREACQQIGYDWRPESLEVLYYNRLIAHEIEQTLIDRNLVYDPQTVKCTALGEGFEQCAMTWKGLLPAYLGLSNPIENDPKLSVTGQPHVVFGKFQERVDLGNDIRLFLWEGPEGEAVALFTRASFRWIDPLQFANVSLKELDLEVSKVEINQIDGSRANQISTITLGPRFDPSPAFQPDPDHLRVPIFAGSRRGGDHAYYIVAPGVDHAAFRQQLLAANVVE